MSIWIGNVQMVVNQQKRAYNDMVGVGRALRDA